MSGQYKFSKYAVDDKKIQTEIWKFHFGGGGVVLKLLHFYNMRYCLYLSATPAYLFIGKNVWFVFSDPIASFSNRRLLKKRCTFNKNEMFFKCWIKPVSLTLILSIIIDDDKSKLLAASKTCFPF